jgi:hypothetical protein
MIDNTSLKLEVEEIDLDDLYADFDSCLGALYVLREYTVLKSDTPEDGTLQSLDVILQAFQIVGMQLSAVVSASVTRDIRKIKIHQDAVLR